MDYVAAGSGAKVIASLVTYPLQVIRARMMQRAHLGSVRYRSLLEAARCIAQNEGLPGFYKGLVPNLLRVTPQQALFFLIYESMLRQLQ